MERSSGGTTLGTREGVRPVYIPQGHRISRSCRRVRRTASDGLRIPQPKREADRFVEAVKRSEMRRLQKPQKIKREAKAEGFHLPGWVGFVAKHPVGILVFRAWMPGKPVFKPVPRMTHAYHTFGRGVNLICEP
jgi:hypothetical protein